MTPENAQPPEAQHETPTSSRDLVGCDDLLAIIKESFDIESFADRWRDQGYTIADAQKAKNAYEDWSGEDIAFDCVDDAIMGANLSGGIFPARLEAFFAAWILSANVKNNSPHNLT